MKIFLIIIILFTNFNLYAIQVKDQKGRIIKFDKPIQRVVSIPIPAPSMFIAIDGSAEKLVGVIELIRHR